MVRSTLEEKLTGNQLAHLDRIFILEGLFTVLVGAVSKWWIVDWPETAKFLNDDERRLLLARLETDTGEAKS